MKRSLLLMTATLLAFSSMAPAAYADRPDSYRDRSWHGQQGRHERDNWRDDRRDDRRDERVVYRHDNGGWHGRHYGYRPHVWQHVTVYTQPEYYSNEYS